jgi:erythromycin esterase-like protein/predicted phosphoribosyltransferase
MRFKNRVDAGRHLAGHLGEYKGQPDVIVLALPRGGVPVAKEVAAQLSAPLDIFLVRKLGMPGHPELAVGAISEGGVEVLDEELVRQLGIPPAVVRQIVARERQELERREALYRGGRPAPDVGGRTVILIDDGLATGSSVEAAVLALRRQAPTRIVVAAPVGAPETCDRLQRIADRVVCATVPSPFKAVGMWYDDFSQTTDDEVREVLGVATRPSTGGARKAARLRDRSRDPVEIIRDRAVRLNDDPPKYDALIDTIGGARVVLLGEATHGTHEFYQERAHITRRLITEKGFAAVAVEADWPDAYRVNRYVRGTSADEEAVQALIDFGRFPTWMWRNADVLDFVGWLRAYNETQPEDRRAGFYGLDLYSLRASMQAVLAYLDKVDPEAATRARQRYGCFDRFGQDAQQYGYAASLGLDPTCEREALTQLVDLHRRRADYASRDGRAAAEDFFAAEQNARLVTSAEAYYRIMFRGRAESWNLRDRHMFETLQELLRHLDDAQPNARIVVWAHNSHVGDARATEMGQDGELNIGQLARQAYGTRAVLVGFTTHTGTVTAASAWDGPAHRKHVRPAAPGSYERLFHDGEVPRFLLPLRTDSDVETALTQARLERAIGVLYLPETERRSHYFHARLAEQFDYVLHFDETHAVEPLEPTALWKAGEVAETFPSGL